MATTTFKDLAKQFPRPEEDFHAKPVTGLDYVTSSNPAFVEPTLRAIKPIEPGRTSVVLLSAPGAVGKSTLAKELAFTTGALLWDLSKFQVGSSTFSGRLLDAYKEKATGVQKRFANGTFFFIFDALDEAQVRAGSQNFDTFLSELVAALRDPRPAPSLALLARTDTAAWVELVFDAAGVPIAHYEIEYFDQPRAFEFIGKQLDQRHVEGKALHRQQAKAYVEARGALFDLIYKVFGMSEAAAWSDERIRDFLGYAPVLEALATYLDVPNYFSFMQELGSEPIDGKDPWQFLTDVVTRILKREQTKMTDAVRGKLEAHAKAAGWSDWSNLYGPDEQLNRVLAYSMKKAPTITKGLPASMLATYDEALSTQLPQHPFLDGRDFANVVFKEFTYGWGLTGGSAQDAERLREVMRHRERPFLPSPLFSRFVVKPDEQGPAVIDGQDFGVVYESLLSRGDGVLLSLDDGLRACVGVDPAAPSAMEVNLIDSGKGVHFWRRLENASVDVGVTLRLGLPEQRFVLGPNVDVTCAHLSVECDDIEVDARAPGVILRAESYASAASPRLRIRNEAEGKLGVMWPGVVHPWAAYQTTEAPGALALGETLRGDTLRKFILMFRAQHSRLRETVLGARIGSTEQREERIRLVNLAEKRGVLEAIDGPPRYVLKTSYLSLMTLLNGDGSSLSSDARKFVVEYLGEDEARRILK
jgi:hypothetical protein